MKYLNLSEFAAKESQKMKRNVAPISVGREDLHPALDLLRELPNSLNLSLKNLTMQNRQLLNYIGMYVTSFSSISYYSNVRLISKINFYWVQNMNGLSQNTRPKPLILILIHNQTDGRNRRTCGPTP